MTKKDLMDQIMGQGDDQEVFLVDGDQEVPLVQVTLEATITESVQGPTRIVLRPKGQELRASNPQPKRDDLDFPDFDQIPG